MTWHRRWRLAGIGIAAIATVAIAGPAVGHKASIGSTVSLRIGYGYFHGKVGSPNAACRVNRTVRLFKAVDGTDPLLKSTTTNSTGQWAIFRPYEEASFYVKVPPRTMKRTGHTHTCKAATSLPATAWPRTTPGDLNGWTVKYFDCLDWLSSGGTSPPIRTSPILVQGPETPPFGFGSLQLIDPEASSSFSRSDTQWDGLDGRPLSTLRSVTFSTYVTGAASPPTMHLHVDVTGDGSDTEEITFTPSDSAVVLDRWQRWTPGQSSTWNTPGGAMTLGAYQASNPSAEFDDFPHGLQFVSECPDSPTPHDPHYMDGVIVRLADETLGFDFEP